MSHPHEIRKAIFTYDADDVVFEAAQRALPEADVVQYVDEEQFAREVVDAQLVLGGALKPEHFALAKAMVWHHVPWVGTEHMPFDEMRERGILLTNSSGINAVPIAEHIIAMMLGFGRQIPLYARFTERSTWRGWEAKPKTQELTDKTVLLLGTGEIGKATAQRLRAFACRILGARRQAVAVEGFDEVVSFDEVLRVLPEADHVVSSLPMTAATAKIVDKTFLDAMKPGSYFYNVGRGGTVDQDALHDALVSGHLAGAGLDVVTPEPLPSDHPLWSAPNVLITSHCAGNSPLSNDRAAVLLEDAIRRYKAGETIPTEVDLDLQY